MRLRLFRITHTIDGATTVNEPFTIFCHNIWTFDIVCEAVFTSLKVRWWQGTKYLMSYGQFIESYAFILAKGYNATSWCRICGRTGHKPCSSLYDTFMYRKTFPFVQAWKQYRKERIDPVIKRRRSCRRCGDQSVFELASVEAPSETVQKGVLVVNSAVELGHQLDTQVATSLPIPLCTIWESAPCKAIKRGQAGLFITKRLFVHCFCLVFNSLNPGCRVTVKFDAMNVLTILSDACLSN